MPTAYPLAQELPAMLKTVLLAFAAVTIATTSLVVRAQNDYEAITIGHHRILDSRILEQERLLYVNLPEGYEESDQRYPVVFQLYAHFQSAYFLPQVRALDSMARHGKCPQMILVGMETNAGRYRDLLPVDHYGATSQIDRFMAFFESELIPFVEENYRAADYRILSGPQAGAAFGIYALSKQPELFNALLLSNPFWVEAARDPLADLFATALDENRFDHHSLVISYEEDEGAGAKAALESFGERLMADKPAELDFLLNPLPADFDYSVSVDFETGILHTFESFELPRDGEPIGIVDVEERYAQLQARLGISLKPAELGLVYQGDKHVERGEDVQAEEIFKYVIGHYPESLMCFVRLGDIYLARGDKEAAREYYERFRRLRPGSPYIQSKIDALGLDGHLK